MKCCAKSRLAAKKTATRKARRMALKGITPKKAKGKKANPKTAKAKKAQPCRDCSKAR